MQAVTAGRSDRDVRKDPYNGLSVDRMQEFRAKFRLRVPRPRPHIGWPSSKVCCQSRQPPAASRAVASQFRGFKV